jgi:hypothetical protein
VLLGLLEHGVAQHDHRAGIGEQRLLIWSQPVPDSTQACLPGSPPAS